MKYDLNEVSKFIYPSAQATRNNRIHSNNTYRLWTQNDLS